MEAIKWIFGVTILVLLTFSSLQAQTTSGTISTDETWSGTIALTGTVTVSSGVTLTISPGTTINSSSTSNRTMTINGTLIANGDLSNRITFQDININIESGSTGSSITYADLKEATTAISVESDVTLNQLTFSKNAYGISLSTNATIENSKFDQNSTYGIQITGSNSNTISIKNNTFSAGPDAIYISGSNKSITVENNLFRFLASDGIYNNSNNIITLNQNTFIGINEYAVNWNSFSGGTLNAHNNIIAYSVNGFSCRVDNDFTANLDYNAFWQNTENYRTSSSYDTCTAGSNDQTVDPKFTGTSLGTPTSETNNIVETWQLDSTSPLLTASSSSGQLGAYGNSGSPPNHTVMFTQTNATTGGTITENEVWSGTVTFTSSVTVDYGKILKILPGTNIIVNNGYRLTINGRLWALGSSTEPITMKKSDSDSFWNGIEINGQGNQVLQHVTLTDVSSSGTNLSLEKNALMTVDASSFTGGNYGVLIKQGDFAVTNSQFQSQNEIGIYFNSDSYAATGTVAGNTFLNIKHGAYLKSKKTATFQNNTFSRGEYGVYITGSQNTVTFQNNLFRFQSNDGVYNNNNNTLTLNHNTFIGTNDYAINWNSSQGGTLNAKDNLIAFGVYGFSCREDEEFSSDLDYNAFWRNTQNYRTASSYAGCSTGNHDQTVDPVFKGTSLETPAVDTDNIVETWQLDTTSPLLTTSSTSGQMGAYGNNGNPPSHTITFTQTNATTTGTISEHETWSGSITLTGNLTIEYGVILKILPGTTIQADQKSITVNGRIWALGTSTEPITFQKMESATHWNGITIAGQGNQVFQNIRMSGVHASSENIWVSKNSDITVDSSILAGGDNGLQITQGTFTVTNNQFNQHSGSGIYLGIGDNAVSGSAKNNVFQDNDRGVYLTGLFKSITLQNNTFLKNQTDHVYVSSSSSTLGIENNSFSGGDYGIRFTSNLDNTAEIQNNLFRFQATYGVHNGGKNTLTVNHNTFIGSGNRAISWDSYSGGTLTAANNLIAYSQTGFYCRTHNDFTVSNGHNAFWKNFQNYSTASGVSSCQAKRTDYDVDPQFKDHWNDSNLSVTSPLLHGASTGGRVGAYVAHASLNEVHDFGTTPTLDGSISTNEEWSGTIVLEDSVTIQAGVVVKILPGTIIQLPKDESININGNGVLWALGTQTQPITFQRSGTDAWYRIYNNGRVVLEQVVIDGAKTGVYNTSSGYLDLTHSVIQNQNDDGLWISAGRATIHHNLFKNNETYGAYLSGGTVDLHHNTFVENVTGIFAGGAAYSIHSNVLVNNNTGLECNFNADDGALRNNVYWNTTAQYKNGSNCPSHATDQTVPVKLIGDHYMADFTGLEQDASEWGDPVFLSADGTSGGVGWHTGQAGKNHLQLPVYSHWLAPATTISLAPLNPSGPIIYTFTENNSGGTLTEEGIYTAGSTTKVTDFINVGSPADTQTAGVSIYVVDTTVSLSITPSLTNVSFGEMYSLSVAETNGPLVWVLQQNQSGGLITEAGHYYPGPYVGGTDTIAVSTVTGDVFGTMNVSTVWSESTTASTEAIALQWERGLRPSRDGGMAAIDWISNRQGERYRYVIDQTANTIPTETDSLSLGNRIQTEFTNAGTFYFHVRPEQNGSLLDNSKTTHETVSLESQLNIVPQTITLITADDTYTPDVRLSVQETVSGAVFAQTLMNAQVAISNDFIAELNNGVVKGKDTGVTALTASYMGLTTTAQIHSFVKDRREIEPNGEVVQGNTNSPVDQSTDLAQDSTREGYLPSSDDIDWYSFTLDESGAFDLSYVTDSTLADVKMTLYNDDLTQILAYFESTDGNNFEMNLLLDSSKYYLKLEPMSGNDMQTDQDHPYELSLQTATSGNYPKTRINYALTQQHASQFYNAYWAANQSGDTALAEQYLKKYNFLNNSVANSRSRDNDDAIADIDERVSFLTNELNNNSQNYTQEEINAMNAERSQLQSDRSLIYFQKDEVYARNSDSTNTLSFPDALYLDLKFDEKTSFEQDKDYLILLDANNQEVGRFTGKDLSGQTLRVWGNTIGFRLVTDSQGGDFGYQVMIEPTVGQANDLDLETEYNGFLPLTTEIGDVMGVFYQFEISSERHITWNVDLRNGQSAIEAELFQRDPQGLLHSLSLFQTATPENSRALTLKAGTYLVNLRGITARNDRLSRVLPDLQNRLPLYAMHLNAGGGKDTSDIEPNNTKAYAETLTFGVPKTGRITSFKDADVYRYDVEESKYYKIALDRSTSDADYTVQLYFQALSPHHLIDEVTIYDTTQRDMSLGLRPGMYYVRVSSRTAGQVDIDAPYQLTFSDYTESNLLEIESNNTATTARSLKNDTAISGRLSRLEDADYYSFRMPDGGDLDVFFTTTSSSLDARMVLLSETGRQVDSRTSENGEDMTIRTGVNPGTFYVRLEIDQSSESEKNFDPENFYNLRVDGTDLTVIEKLDSLNITGGNMVNVGNTLSLTVQGNYADGSASDLTQSVQWTVSNNAVATINGDGTLTGVASGVVTVTATSPSQAEVKGLLEVTVGEGGDQVSQTIGNAIILAGGGAHSGNKLWKATQYLSNQAYRTFKLRTFTDQDILYLNPVPFQDLDGDGFSDDVVDIALIPDQTAQQLLEQMIDWAVAQPSTGPLYWYLMDHGDKNKFQILPSVVLTEDQLRTGLERFQSETQREVVLILEYCFSGTFVDLASDNTPGIAVVTSTGDNLAYLTGSGAISYSQFFWQNIAKGATLADSHETTKTRLSDQGRPYSRQTPMIDGPNTLQNQAIGPEFVTAPLEVSFVDVPSASTLESNTSHTFSVKLSGLSPDSQVWFTVTPPAIGENNVTGEFYTPVDTLDRVNMAPNNNDQFEGSYSFRCTGDNQLNFYALDDHGRLTPSTPVTIKINGGVDCSADTVRDVRFFQYGWNLFGLSHTDGDVSPDTYFSDATDAVVWGWDQGWHIWPEGVRTNLNETFNTDFGALTTLQVHRAYWVNLNNSTQLLRGSTAITTVPDLSELSTGWHLVSFGNNTLTAESLLTSNPDVSFIWAWNGGGWEVRSRQGQVGNYPLLESLGAGKGYWIRK